MIEDSGFIRNRTQKKEEREYAPDVCGSLGKGMLANEALRNAPGLTPLSFDLDIHKRNLNRCNDIVDVAGLSNMEITKNIETIRNVSGLSPLHYDNEPQKAPLRSILTKFAVRVTEECEINDR